MADILTRTLAADHTTPVRAYAALRSHAPGRSSFLLESASPGERWGRYSILGYRTKNETMYPGLADPFPLLHGDLTAVEAPEGLAARFSQALVGYISYDAVNRVLGIEPWPDEESLARMMRDATVVVFDNLHHTMTIGGRSKGAIDRCEWEMAHGHELPVMSVPDPLASPEYADPSMDDAVFGAKAARARALVDAGEALQVVLARTFTSPQREADPFDVYRALRVLSPSPYLYFLEFGETPFAPGLTVIGASPETMVQVSGGRMTLRPIAGARTRGATAVEDDAIAADLLSDPIAQDTHDWMIELARSDAQRVCDPASVEPAGERSVERRGRAMHIVSEVSGAPLPSASPLDVVRAAFPSGALTGMPRARAAKIIRDLEPQSRGVYGGAVGYLGADGNLDLAIAVSTILFKQGQFHVTAGAGISSGSTPEGAAAETREKAQLPLAAVRAAQDAVLERRARATALEAARAAKVAKAEADKANESP